MRKNDWLSQWQLESLMQMDFAEMDEKSPENIYQQADDAKLDKGLLCFECPDKKYIHRNNQTWKIVLKYKNCWNSVTNFQK